MSMEENLRKYIDELIQEVEHELDEATTTAGVDGYQTPFAFGGGRDKDKKKQKKNIDVTGYTKVKDIDESVNEAMVSPKNGHQFFQLTKDTPIKFIKSQSGMNAPGVFLHNKDGFIKGKKDAYLIDYFGAAFYVDLKNKFASKIYPMKDQTDLRYNSNFKETDKAPEMSDWKKFLKESVNEGPMDRIFGGIPYTKKGKQSIVTMKLPDDVKERIIQRAKKEGKVAKPNNGGGVTVFESVNEAKVIDIVDRFLDVHLPDVTYLNKKPYTGLAFFMNGFNGYDSSKSDGFLIDSKTNKPLTDKKGNILRSKKHRSVELKFKNGVEQSGRFNESVNEAKVKRPVNRWLELKNDDTMHPHKKMAHGLKELKYQLAETEKFFKWYNKIKNINELESSNYWKRTQSHIYKIKERLVNIARTIQEIEK